MLVSDFSSLSKIKQFWLPINIEEQKKHNQDNKLSYVTIA